MKDFRRLDVWSKAHECVLAVYWATASFPSDERYGVTAQPRRACASVPTNIAEGCGRNTEVELRRFLEIAMGSAGEVEYLLLLSRDLEYLNGDAYQRLADSITEVKRMLTGFIQKLRAES